MAQNIDYTPIGEEATFEENAQFLAQIIRELTGEWIHYVECDDIQGEDRTFFDEMVFFGDKEDLEGEGIAANLVTLSMVDRYGFDEQRVHILYNDDP